ncbi:transient receptor potential channel pyrexia-like isoform X2 [Homarus americanus]|uniref:transient receptor potential channel pyrexia-like isoform X2 n=1 Tax=Homarus americanus TaxID=6706 RepID=UPI001C48B0C8|nr:transient receptor potential channel pyrexia-like isoform X2 [Homarus americanus]
MKKSTVEECSFRDSDQTSFQLNGGNYQSGGRQAAESTGRFSVLDVTVITDDAAASLVSLPASQLDEHDSLEFIPPLFVAIKTGDVRGLRDILAVDAKAASRPKYGGFPPLHAACNVKNLHILRELLTNDAKVGALGGLGHTALHLAVSEGWHEGVAELLQHGASPDAMLEPPSTVKGMHVETSLHSAVRRGDLTSTVLMLERQPDLTLTDSNNCTVLHLAAQARSPEIIHQLLQKKLPNEVVTVCDRDNNSVLHKALLRNCDAAEESKVCSIVEELVKAGAKVNSINNQGESPLFLAAQQRLPKLVELLLSLEADPTIVTRRGQSVLHAACKHGCTSCLGYLLATNLVKHLVTEPDNEGREPFHYAVHSGSIDCCELLLNNGDHLTRLDKDGVSRCSLILEHLPSALQLLRRLFDAHVLLSNNPQHDADFRVTFDYSVLSSEKEGIQSSLTSELSNSRLEALLKHPLLESFLFIKWRKIKPLFYCSVLIYLMFLLVHTTFIVMTYGANSWNWHDKRDLLTIFILIHVVMFLLILIPDLIIMFANFKKYLRQWETLTKSIALGSSAIVVFSNIIFLDNKTSETTNVMADNVISNITAGNFSQNSNVSELGTGNYNRSRVEMPLVQSAAAISGFFCWVEFMMLLGRFPSLGTYVLMFSRVARSIIKFIAAFSSLIIGFAISFMVLFHNQKPFKSFPLSLVKTLMMMIGEIDYNSLMSELEERVLSCIFLVSFLFLVCVLMANLLIGLAVNDIPDLQRQGKIKRLSKQASYLVSYEKLMIIARNMSCFPRQLRILMSSRCRIPQRVNVLPNKHHSSTRKSLEHNVPSETLQEAILLGNCEDSNDDLNNIEEEDLMGQFKSFKLKYARDRRALNRRLAQLPDSTATEKMLKESMDQMQQIVQNQLTQLSLQLQQYNHNCTHCHPLPSTQKQRQRNRQPQEVEYYPPYSQNQWPTLSVLQQSVQTQSVPLQTVKTQSVPQQTLQTQSMPQQILQTQSVPQHTLQTQSVPQQILQTQSVPQQTLQTQSVPQQTVQTQSVPQQTVQTQSVPQQTLQTQSVPQQTLQTQSVPQQTVQTQSVPQQTVQTQLMPRHCVLQQSVQKQQESYIQQPQHPLEQSQYTQHQTTHQPLSQQQQLTHRYLSQQQPLTREYVQQ